MSRIRTIKPEFWTDEKIVKLPFEARLVFVGMWNFADDEGYLADEPERLRLQILPSDPVDIFAIVDLLCAAGLLERFEVGDDSAILRISGFTKHQKISHPSPSRLANVPGKKVTVSASVRRAVAIKYGCKPGGDAVANCYHCGAAGRIWWPPLYGGRPGAWVAFSDLELDHFIPERAGGDTTAENIVLSCRYCNRSRGAGDALALAESKMQNIPENSGKLRPDREGNGVEGKGENLVDRPRSPSQTAPPREPKVKRGVPEDWRPTERGCSYALDRAAWASARVDSEVERFRAYHRKNGNRFVEIDAAWQTWVQNGAKFDQAGGTAGRGVAAPDAESEWRDRLSMYRDRGSWHADTWGPKPGDPACMVPPRLLAELTMADP